MKKIEVKPNVTHEVQLAMTCDVKYLLPRTCAHPHELNQQEGFTQEGPRETKMAFEQLGEFVIGKAESNESSNMFHKI